MVKRQITKQQIGLLYNIKLIDASISNPFVHALPLIHSLGGGVALRDISSVCQYVLGEGRGGIRGRDWRRGDTIQRLVESPYPQNVSWPGTPF